MTDMQPNDGNGPGDDRGSAKKKRAPGARKRGAKAAKATEQNGATATEREVAPQAQVKPAQTQSNVADRSVAEARGPGQRTSGERPVDLGTADERGYDDERNYGDGDAERAADVAADLKSWLDTRREDRGSRGEVL
jgi:hypothetical protein